jgi:hypothetical protein
MKIIFFSPHSAIWVHAFPEALVAETLQQSGHDVVYVACGEVLQDQCVAMSASGIDFSSTLRARKRVCGRCNANKKILRQRVGLNGYDMADILKPEDLAEIELIISKLSAANYAYLEIDNVPVGRYALYELILRRKKSDFNLNDEEWREYKTAVRGALVALSAGRKILEREQPERLITYNSLYAVNRVMSRLAELRGIATCFLHAGGNLSRRLQTLMLGRDSTFSYLKSLIAEWPRFRSIPCKPELMEQITMHFLVLFAGESVFSYSTAAGKEPLDVRSRFGVRPDQRLLVATMSSPDERFAAQTVDALPLDNGLLFPTQVDWIQALIRFVASRPDLFLLIRVHPREFPNKREGIKSKHAALLAGAFQKLPKNACVNWPTDEIALYDLANYADVFLNAWSSAGKEMALLGIPVVGYSPDLVFYPAELNYIGKTEKDFFNKIDQALEDGWSIERSRAVFRWLAVEYGYGLVDISDSYRQTERARLTFTAKVLRRLRTFIDRDRVQIKDCDGRSDRLFAHTDIERTIRLAAHTPLDLQVARSFSRSDLEAEDRALHFELTRLGKVLFGESLDQKPGPLATRLATISRHERRARGGS